jgi:hypothetical protein
VTVRTATSEWGVPPVGVKVTEIFRRRWWVRRSKARIEPEGLIVMRTFPALFTILARVRRDGIAAVARA